MQRMPLVLVATLALVATGCAGSTPSGRPSLVAPSLDTAPATASMAPEATAAPDASATPEAIPSPTTSAAGGPTARLLFNRDIEAAEWSGTLVLESSTGELLAAPWTDAAMPTGEGWSPDGGSLIGTIMSPDFLSELLQVVPVDPSRPATPLAEVSIVDSVQMSPDGQWVAYVTPGPAADTRTRVMLVPADGSADPIELLASSQVDEPGLAWDPHGTRLAVVGVPAGDEGLGGGAIALVDVPSGEVGRRFDVPAMGGLHWSPDGRRLAFTGAGYPHGPFVLDVESGDVTRLVPDDILSNVMGFQADWIDDATLVGVGVGESSTVYRIRLDDGMVEALASLPFASDLAVSPDGRWVAVSVVSLTEGSEGTSLSAVSTDDGRVVELTPATQGVRDLDPTWQPVPADVPWEPWSAPTGRASRGPA